MIGMFTFGYIVSIIIMTAACYFIVIARFYKHLLSNEGYLTFSLPISPTTHLVCKLLCACVMSVFSVLVAIVSFNVVFAVSGGSYVDVFREFTDIDISPEIMRAIGPKLISVFAIMLVCAVISLFQGILLPYASMCIGQLSKKNKLAMSFLWYFILNNVANIINNIVSTVMTFTIVGNTSYYETAETPVESMTLMLDSFQMSMIQITLTAAVFTIVYFLIARYILNNKLNLE